MAAATAMVLAALPGCGSDADDDDVPSTATASTSTTVTARTSAASTTTSNLGLVVDAEVPNRISDIADPNVVLHVFVTSMRDGDYVPPLSDQEVVDAGQMVCRFYDDDRPGAAKGSSSLMVIATGILILHSDEPLFDHPVYDTLLAWLADAPRGADSAASAVQDDAMESISQLAAGSAVSFCPEHRDKLDQER